MAGLLAAVTLGLVWWGGDAAPRGDTSWAYIGPGAGIALLGSFLAVLSGFISALFFIVTYPIRLVWRSIRSGRAMRRARVRRVVILGLDGLEPELTERFLEEGRLPNLARLREQGTYTRLGTTTPPLSPVAWSSFATGTNPGKHNIFDFISRDPRTYRPTQSSVRIAPPRRRLRLGRFVLPLSRARIDRLRRSRPFWKVLGDAGIFSAVLRVPITFPPDRFRGVQLAAMCVPDLRGTHGTFSYFSEGEAGGATTDGDVGGEVIPVHRHGEAVEAKLLGPPDSFRPERGALTATVRVTRRGDQYTLRVGRESVELKPGVFTDWVRVPFRVLGPLRVTGLCRFMLKQFDAPFEMYCTPIQIDPLRPVMPISHPAQYARYLARRFGAFATLGLAEDTWALSEERLDEDGFLQQAYDVHEEREAMFFDAMRQVRRGLVTCVFDAPDRIQHMFWRFIDPGHPARPAGDGGAHDRTIEEMYERMDGLVGRTIDACDEHTALFVMSDHGFKPFRRGVDLNAWLQAEGYLTLRDGAKTPSGAYLADIDWTRTKAYALGLAGIFLNVRGRERDGIVAPNDVDALRAEIANKLTGLQDPDAGTVAIHEAMPRETVYRGPYVDHAADVIVGYRPGYRVSWDAVIGKCGDAIFSDNTKAWSGDHCIHPALVPGVLFSDQRLDTNDASIIDLAPTTLELFGLDAPKYIDGRSLLCPTPAA